MARVKFTKMHGVGNDYIYFDCLANPDLIPCPDKTAITLSNRHFGIGGDGIVLLLPSTAADFRMRIFNADGSEAEMCGNAIRCVAKYLLDNHCWNDKTLRIETASGVKTVVATRDADGVFLSARVDMGKPVLNGPDIPVNIDKREIVGEKIALADGRTYTATCVSMGNPHCVIFVDAMTDNQVLLDGKELERHSLFPRRTNVEFVAVLNRHKVVARVWERGAGETLACGTGASAVCVACVLNGLTDREIIVHLPGGELRIEWADNDHVFMTGPATFVCDGMVDLG